MTGSESAADTAPADGDAGRPLLCGGCGYDLSHSTGRCPECGRRFDPKHLTEDLIPWEQRRSIGRLRAYGRTVMHVTFRPWLVAGRVAMPVSLADARAFRRVTAVVASLPFAAAALSARPWAVRQFDRSGDPRDEWVRLLVNPWSLGLLVAGALMAVAAMTRLAAPLFNRRALPPPLRQRARAVGCYSCAPLVLVIPVTAVAASAWWLNWATLPSPGASGYGTYIARPHEPLLDAAETLAWACAPALAAVAGGWLWATLYLLRTAARCGWGRVAAAGVALPFGWALCLAVIPAAVQLLAAFLVLVVLSLSRGA